MKSRESIFHSFNNTQLIQETKKERQNRKIYKRDREKKERIKLEELRNEKRRNGFRFVASDTFHDNFHSLLKTKDRIE